MEEDKQIHNCNVSDVCTCSILSSTSVLRLCFYTFPGKLRMMQSKTDTDRFLLFLQIQSGIIWLFLCAFANVLERCCGCWLTGHHKVAWVAQQSSACGQAALTLGQRLPYCGPTAFLPFRASSLSSCPPYWSKEGCGLVYFSCSQLYDRN